MSTCNKALCRHVTKTNHRGVGGGREGGEREATGGREGGERVARGWREGGERGARGGREGGERGREGGSKRVALGWSKRGVARFTEHHRKWKEMKTELAHLISAPYAS